MMKRGKDHLGDLVRMVCVPISPPSSSPSICISIPMGRNLLFWCHLTGFGGVEPEPEPTMTSDEAWAALVSADQEEDLDDFKVFFLEYFRNNKDLTFVELEKKFREEGLGVYLIAIVMPHFHPHLSSSLPNFLPP